MSVPNEYNSDKIVLRDTSGNQMSLPRFFQLALDDGNGHTTNPSQGPSSSHKAWDMGAGNYVNVVPVRSPITGTVSDCGDGWNGGMGTFASIDEGNGRTHRFMHMAEGSLRIVAGDTISQGDTIGFIGNTGDSTGPHLHYDILLNGNLIDDPIDAYDSTTLPSGWTMNGAASAGNWDYIQLDHTATDYGPPGGDTPSEPFFPTARCYDISWAQLQNGNLDTCLEAIAASGAAGVIIQIGSVRSNGYDSAETDPYVSHRFDTGQATSKALSLGLALGVYFYNYAAYESDMTTAFQAALSHLQTISLTPDKLKLGIWLDTEQSGGGWDPTPNPNPAVNYAYVERFMNVFSNADYPVAGVYGNAALLSTIYPAANIGDKPLWPAMWVSGNYDDFDRSWLDNYFPENVYTKVYIWQYSDSEIVSGWGNRLDGDKVVTPMPTEGGGGGGGGGEYTEVINVTVDVIAPKRIYFSPNPGIIQTESELLSERTATIEITTDADNAYLYYTTDGSAPYQYTPVLGGVVNAVAANALLYDEPIIINKDTHIRVVAVPAGKEPGDMFEKPLAKGSGTYLFEYHNLSQEWEEEQKSYATSDDNTSFFEENLQAFLRVHAELTEEEVLYTDVYTHDSQVEEEDAKDDASTTDSDEPIPIPPETESEQVGD